MPNSHIAKAVVIFACAALAWQLLVVLPELPDRLASKFAFDWAPQGSSSKAVFAWIFGAIAAAMVLAFAGVGLLHHVPDRYVNFPNREEWLASGKRAAAIEDVVGAVRLMLAASVTFLAAACWLVIEANRISPPKLSSAFFVLLAAYVAGLIAAAVWLHRRFRNPPAKN